MRLQGHSTKPRFAAVIWAHVQIRCTPKHCLALSLEAVVENNALSSPLWRHELQTGDKMFHANQGKKGVFCLAGGRSPVSADPSAV